MAGKGARETTFLARLEALTPATIRNTAQLTPF
jgi:hypothetical protein